MNQPDLASLPKPASELRLRVISALVLAIGILATTLLGGWSFRVVWAAVAGLVLYEWLSMMGRSRMQAVAAGFALTCIALAQPWLGWPLAVMGLVILSGALYLTASEEKVLAFSAVPYAAVIALVPSALRDMPETGGWLILWTFAVVWFTDIAAYFTGRALGGPKLAPRFSPKKTWSGAIGGACAGVAGGALIFWSMRHFGVMPPVSLVAALLISLAASGLGQAGDIAESAFKRHFQVKDSGHLIPGHGGFMDRLDAYWAVLALCGAILALVPAAS